jgi:hypothetical protein
MSEAESSEVLTAVSRKGIVRFEVFTAVTMKNAVFWDVTSCGFCKNRRFGGAYRLHHQGGLVQLLVIANNPDDGGGKFLRNVGTNKSHMASHLRRRHFSGREFLSGTQFV